VRGELAGDRGARVRALAEGLVRLRTLVDEETLA
jgi:hypothetical protein